MWKTLTTLHSKYERTQIKWQTHLRKVFESLTTTHFHNANFFVNTFKKLIFQRRSIINPSSDTRQFATNKFQAIMAVMNLTPTIFRNYWSSICVDLMSYFSPPHITRAFPRRLCNYSGTIRWRLESSAI